MSINEINKLICVFGLGQSGVSAARYLERTKQDFFVVDTRENPAGKDDVLGLVHCKQILLGEFSQERLNNASMIILSPGISKKTHSIQIAAQAGVEVIGDIELFVRNTNKKIVAITGSNGKSTVTDLAYELLKASGVNACIGGNYGVPALDYLPSDEAEIYVLELSSFQLDTTPSIQADVGVLLNISEDHMDRYDSFEEYRLSKHHLIHQAKSIIVNADDDNINTDDVNTDNLSSVIKFTTKTESKNNVAYSLSYEKDDCYIMVNSQPLIRTSELQLSGIHNWSNILAALAIFEHLNIAISDAVIERLKNYQGLEHRFQLVHRGDNVDWINDSKATNVGATQAALNSIDTRLYSLVVLIAGGDAKGSDLEPLRKSFVAIDYVVLLGKDAKQLSQLIEPNKVTLVDSMTSAVLEANNFITKTRQSQSMSVSEKALVLLSPACSSLDMYKNFEARGQAFIDAVRDCA